MLKIRAVFETLKEISKKLKDEVMALYLAYKRPDVSMLAKIVAALVVGYALSPIDLIPDFIPVLGYLDDLILLPLGIALAIRLVPRPIMDECRAEAKIVYAGNKPKNRLAAFIVVLLWVVIISMIISKIIPE